MCSGLEGRRSLKVAITLWSEVATCTLGEIRFMKHLRVDIVLSTLSGHLLVHITLVYCVCI